MAKKKVSKKKNKETKQPGDWIIDKHIIKEWPGGQFSVQVTKPYIRTDENKDNYGLTLFKSWWSSKDHSLISFSENYGTFKNRRTFNIGNLDDYEAIRDAIENKLVESLKWDIKKSISKLSVDSEDISNIKKIVETSPKTGLEFIKEINTYIENAKEEGIDLTFLKDLSKLIFDISSKLNSKIFDSLKDLIPKLAKERKEDIESFNRLLGEYGLSDINTLTEMITQRLKAIEFFDELVVNDETKEMSDDRLNSMHHFLDDNMWILDEAYEWYLSNRQIKTLIQKDMEKKDKKHEKKRPDFALAHDDTKTLVIAEIKRPSHNLSLDDMRQLMEYNTLAEKYMGKSFSNFKGYLIGRQMDDDLKANLKNFRGFEVKTYTNITSAAKKRYSEFLKILEKKKQLIIK